MLRAGQGDEFFRQQLASMAQLVPFSNCDTESELMSKLNANGASSWRNTVQTAADLEDPLLGGAASAVDSVGLAGGASLPAAVSSVGAKPQQGEDAQPINVDLLMQSV